MKSRAGHWAREHQGHPWTGCSPVVPPGKGPVPQVSQAEGRSSPAAPIWDLELSQAPPRTLRPRAHPLLLLAPGNTPGAALGAWGEAPGPSWGRRPTVSLPGARRPWWSPLPRLEEERVVCQPHGRLCDPLGPGLLVAGFPGPSAWPLRLAQGSLLSPLGVLPWRSSCSRHGPQALGSLCGSRLPRLPPPPAHLPPLGSLPLPLLATSSLS